MSIGVCDVSESDDSPISLELKLCEGRECEKVFGRVRRCDVDMSGDGGLCVCMKVWCVCSCSVMVWRKSERIDV